MVTSSCQLMKNQKGRCKVKQQEVLEEVQMSVIQLSVKTQIMALLIFNHPLKRKVEIRRDSKVKMARNKISYRLCRININKIPSSNNFDMNEDQNFFRNNDTSDQTQNGYNSVGANLYQPSHKLPGTDQSSIAKMDSKQRDLMMQIYSDPNRLTQNARDKIAKIIEPDEPTPNLLAQNNKNPYDKAANDFLQQYQQRPQPPPVSQTGQFVTGSQVKADIDSIRRMNHQAKNQYYNDQNQNQRNSYGGFNSNNGQSWQNSNSSYGGWPNNQNYNPNYQNRYPPPYDQGYNNYSNGPQSFNNQYQYEDDNSATDRFLNNQGRQPGIGGPRRKFVVPTKEQNSKGSGGGQAGGFHPGRSVMQHMLNNGTNQEEKKEGDIDIQLDDRYKNLDQRMVELIENEIMERQLDVDWNDIAGLEYAKKIIQEIIIWPMQRPDLFKGLRAPPRGVLFFGPPGTGKTLLGKAISAQTKSTFMAISASTLTSKWVGEGEKMVRTMFAIAAIHQPTVIFIDEIDSLLCSRNENDIESSRRIKTEFLVQLDGANSIAGDARILIIGATNRPHDLDEAVRRRLVKKLYIPLPNKAGRRQFIDKLLLSESQSNQKINLDEQSINTLVELTKGYSGADLKTLGTEAAMIPLRQISDISNISIDDIRPLDLSDFQEALKNVKASVNQNDLEKYLEWNNQYGSVPLTIDDLKD
eukprot:403330656